MELKNNTYRTFTFEKGEHNTTVSTSTYGNDGVRFEHYWHVNNREKLLSTVIEMALRVALAIDSNREVDESDRDYSWVAVHRYACQILEAISWSRDIYAVEDNGQKSLVFDRSLL